MKSSSSTPWILKFSTTSVNCFKCRWGSSVTAHENWPMFCSIWNIIDLNSNWESLNMLVLRVFGSNIAYSLMDLSLSSAMFIMLLLFSMLTDVSSSELEQLPPFPESPFYFSIKWNSGEDLSLNIHDTHAKHSMNYKLTKTNKLIT